jgi:hypothetical protein
MPTEPHPSSLQRAPVEIEQLNILAVKDPND